MWLDRLFFFFSSRRRHTRYIGDWSSDVCSSDLAAPADRDVVKLLPTSLSAGAAAGTYGGTTTLSATLTNSGTPRSEERRVGKEWRSRWSRADEKKRRLIDTEDRSLVGNRQ